MARLPVACVMGNTDIVRCLVPLGVRCAAVASPGAPVRYSRYVSEVVEWSTGDDGVAETDTLARLERFAEKHAEPPVLFFETDAFLLFVSRHRDRLAESFRFVIDRAANIDAWVDKSRFVAVAERHGLSVPPARIVIPAEQDPSVVDDLGYPMVVKPIGRGDGRWATVEKGGKALLVADAGQMGSLWGRLAGMDRPVLAQTLIPGPETRIESYHVYVDGDGRVAAEFTGRKVRTLPVEFGHSTALVITDEQDVRDHGRRVVEALGLRGVAKLDFKRDGAGGLWLLEINPRLSIWNHLGAVAGANIPAMIYADLAGSPRPAAGPVRVGARWWHPWDLRAARHWNVSTARSWEWCARADARSVVNWDDPMPLLGHLRWRAGQRLRAARRNDKGAR